MEVHLWNDALHLLVKMPLNVSKRKRTFELKLILKLTFAFLFLFRTSFLMLPKDAMIHLISSDYVFSNY